ncbi:MAG: hypothetical protein ABSB15_27555 [Bryobacteraceae bacterium]|jgi:hypothetical protein
MSNAFKIGFGVTLVVIAFLVWRGFVATKGNHLDPVGRIGKVREQKVDDNEVVVVLDFNLRNDADLPMIVRSVEAGIDAPDGSVIDGKAIGVADLANVFRNYPDLGEQYNPPLKARDELKAHDSIDRMVGFRFDVPEDRVLKRKDIFLHIEDITGPVAELKTK